MAVFLVDDDASVRKALTRLIKSAGYQVHAFASADEFLDYHPDADGPGCLVLEVRMPGLNGLDLQRKLHDANVPVPIIFITGHGDIPTSVKAMKAGAVDFLPKPVQDHELLRAIDHALARSKVEGAKRAEIAEILRRVETLTPREHEVMEFVATGMLNKQIAYQLGTVEKTIKVHRARVMEKMAVGSVAELVRIVERAGLGKT